MFIQKICAFNVDEIDGWSPWCCQDAFNTFFRPMYCNTHLTHLHLYGEVSRSVNLPKRKLNQLLKKILINLKDGNI